MFVGLVTVVAKQAGLSRVPCVGKRQRTRVTRGSQCFGGVEAHRCRIARGAGHAGRFARCGATGAQALCDVLDQPQPVHAAVGG